MFSGTLDAPSFVAGIYVLSPGFGPGNGGTLTITQVAEEVPEPATLVLLGAGLLALGAARRGGEGGSRSGAQALLSAPQTD